MKSVLLGLAAFSVTATAFAFIVPATVRVGDASGSCRGGSERCTYRTSGTSKNFIRRATGAAPPSMQRTCCCCASGTPAPLLSHQRQHASQTKAARNRRSKNYPRSTYNLRRTRATALCLQSDSFSEATVAPLRFVQKDSLLKETAKALRRTSWFSWWSQVILTTVSSVILLFAKSVLTKRLISVDGGIGGGGPSFFLSGCGVLLSAVSIVWTWGNGARLSRRLLIKPVSRVTAAHMLRRAIRVGATINLLGLLCNLMAAEQIIGSLAIKVLTTARAANILMMPTSGMELQPLDVLIVQANTNSLLSQFCSLVSLLALAHRVDLLDPPSTDEAPRSA